MSSNLLHMRRTKPDSSGLKLFSSKKGSGLIKEMNFNYNNDIHKLRY